MLFFNGREKYVCEHTSTLTILPTNHNQSLRVEQGLTPHSHHTRNKCTLIIPYLMPLELFYQTQIMILPCMYFCFFPWQRTFCNILPLFLYLGGSTGSGYHQYDETIVNNSNIEILMKLTQYCLSSSFTSSSTPPPPPLPLLPSSSDCAFSTVFSSLQVFQFVMRFCKSSLHIRKRRNMICASRFSIFSIFMFFVFSCYIQDPKIKMKQILIFLMW